MRLHRHRIFSIISVLALTMVVGIPTAHAATDCVIGPGVTQDATTVTGSPNDDTIDCSGATPGKTIKGMFGNDTITGTPYKDNISGGRGNDTITGGVGPDYITGDVGRDTMTGSAGNDFLSGGRGNDTFSGSAGNDEL